MTNWPWEITGIIDRLRHLVGKGDSNSQIAAQLNKEFGTNFSRNAIIGKTHRLELIRTVPRKQNAEAQRSIVLVTRIKAEKKNKTPPIPKPDFDPKEVFIDKGQGRPTSTRKANECAWPLGDGSSCCQPITRGSYCDFHASIAYSATKSDEAGLMRSVRRALG